MQVIQTILDCSVEVGLKCGVYATLVGMLLVIYCTEMHVATAHTQACGSHLFSAAGLWHADEEIIVTALLDKACEGLNEALTTGDRYRARLLLRLLAALTTTNVVSMQSMFSMLNSMVTAAMQTLEQGEPVWPHLSHALLLCFCFVFCCFSALPCMLSSKQTVLCKQGSTNSACCIINSMVQLLRTAPAESSLA